MIKKVIKLNKAPNLLLIFLLLFAQYAFSKDKLLTIEEQKEGHFTLFYLQFLPDKSIDSDHLTFTLYQGEHKVIDSMVIMPWRNQQDIHWFQLQRESDELSKSHRGAKVLVLKLRNTVVEKGRNKLIVEITDRKHKKSTKHPLSQAKN